MFFLLPITVMDCPNMKSCLFWLKLGDFGFSNWGCWIQVLHFLNKFVGKYLII